MGWGDIEIREKAENDFEAELRYDQLINGDNGCWISVVGWGETEEGARANLKMALAEMTKAPEV